MFGQVWAFGVDIVPERKQNKSRRAILLQRKEKNCRGDTYLSGNILIDTLLKQIFKTNPAGLSSLGSERNILTVLIAFRLFRCFFVCLFEGVRTYCVSREGKGYDTYLERA